MSRVRVYELSKAAELRALQSRINGRLARMVKGLRTTLVRSADGAVGYSLQGVTSAGGRRLLDAAYGVISEELGIRRGRPRMEVTRQVKCRIPERLYRRLADEARRRKTTPATLVREIVARHVG